MASIITIFSFSTIAKAYVYLLAVIVSVLAGLSIIFLLARKIYQQRKHERIQLIEGIRSREDQLFRTFELDFKSILERKEING